MEIYILSVLAMAGIYAVLAVSYDLVFGQAGMFSISHGAFFGIGAYVSALSMIHAGAPFLLALVLGGFAAACIGMIVAFPASRLDGDYLIVGSLAFAVITYELMLNLTSVTRGPMGVPGIPGPSLLGWELDSPRGQLVVILLLLAVTLLVNWRLVRSPYGRLLRAMRDDPIAVEASGKSVFMLKVQVMTIASFFAGAAGAVYASYVRFIDPESFLLRTSFVVVVACVLGGAGSLWGPALGALLVWFTPELLRFAGIPSSLQGPINEIAYGLILLAIIFMRPAGLIGQKRYTSSAS